jgi:hypothetical protein
MFNCFFIYSSHLAENTVSWRPITATKHTYKCLHVNSQLFLSDSNQTPNVSTNFIKSLKYEISLKSVRWESLCSVRIHGQTDRDMEKLIQSLFAILWQIRLKSKRRTKIQASNRKIRHLITIHGADCGMKGP